MKLSEKRQQMLAIVEQWQQSGQTQLEFAKEKQISLSKLRYWIRYARENQPGNFIQLSSPLASTLIIRYPNGVELQLPPQTPASILRGLIFI